MYKNQNPKFNESLEDIKNKIIQIDRPLVIGYSGGKDSTCVVQLVWKALEELSLKDWKHHVFVVCCDTLVETPQVLGYLQENILKMNIAARNKGLPLSVHKVFPKADNTFWVNLIGKGYPAPRTKFRWCTDRLKIEPVNQFILDVASKYGEVVIVLGVRKDESIARAQVLKEYELEKNQATGVSLPRHSTLPNAFIFTPIASWSTEDVWDYLLSNTNTPWGGSNRELSAMYKEASDGECPLVIDKTTASCGNSRFGCWVCTVVEKNKSLENVVDKGEEWLEPLIDFRNLLMETTDPTKKSIYRSHVRRAGSTQLMNNSKEEDEDPKLIRGPYYFEFRKQLLLKLLGIQKKIKEKNSEIELISNSELKEIRRLWITEENDWKDSVLEIYSKIYNQPLNFQSDDTASFGATEFSLLKEACEEIDVSPDLVARLIDKEREFTATGKKLALMKELDGVLSREWRTEEDVLAALKGNNNGN